MHRHLLNAICTHQTCIYYVKKRVSFDATSSKIQLRKMKSKSHISHYLFLIPRIQHRRVNSCDLYLLRLTHKN